MKISQLINDLQEIERQRGDIPIVVNISGFGGHAQYMTLNTRPQKMYISTCDDEFQLRDSEKREMYPDWSPGNDLEDDVQVVTINCGSIISAS